ncbi:MAG: hypothetical protein JWO06_2716 [Bacteroidota bacterium]|nr:hypothetical protein [Bacteroidota bacterium]
MNRVLTFCLVFSFYSVCAQKYDYRWILGYTPYSNSDILFTSNTADTMSSFRGVDMDNSQTTISDSAGNLLFYTNGAKIYTSHDSIMMNGDSINYGWVWDDNFGTLYPALEDIIAMPTSIAGIWNLFHYYVEYNPNSNLGLYPWRIYNTRLDMTGNSGAGKVLFKDSILVQDTLGSYVQACKHANGRDWWILTSKISSNCLYTLLVEPDTIKNLGTQCLGGNYTGGDAGQASFSPDGSKFAWVGGLSGVNLYDFDRCTGHLSNNLFLPFFWKMNYNDQYGLAFSPNSRFLYIAQSQYILQFDTWSSDIVGSVDTVGYNQPPPDSSFPGPFFLMQLAPDGKIYVSASNGIKYLHVINNPDKLGESCNFVNYGFPLPNYNSFGLPSYPNYRLGALVGSPCDTLATFTTAIQADKKRILKVFPNPASDFVVIDYGFTDWNKGQVSLQVDNELGQIVYEQKLPMYSGFQKIDLSKFSIGLYRVNIIRAGAVVASSSLVKQ